MLLFTSSFSRGARWPLSYRTATVLLGLLVACGGSGEGALTTVPATSAGATTPPFVPTSVRDATRLADQATFGPTEGLVASIKAQGANAWVSNQLTMPVRSRYTSGGTGAIHQYTGENGFCDVNPSKECWRDNFSTEPLVWDFFKNAVNQPDQLRQRVALALQQILVVSNRDIQGTYGFRYYNNHLLNLSFGNYRDILKKITLAPVMGEFLNSVNNNKDAPNENYARELLQLFSVGACDLNPDGSFKNGQCTASYNTSVVRSYAFALTGWTYPAGGRAASGECWPKEANCRYYEGDMIPLPLFHDTNARTLMSGYSLPAGHTAQSALDAVLDSLMAHPNMAPFIGKQLIQHLVSSNPSPAYVERVARAFTTGKFQTYGAGLRGDLSATVAAILLDPEARGDTPVRNAGKLREPVQMFAGVVRALNGKTDGSALSDWWGSELGQHLFRSPSVFNFFPPDFPVAGTTLVGPAFAIHNANTALGRFNFITYLIDWDVPRLKALIYPTPSVPKLT
jgi:uncharacterized protein (DUF1800 family)